MPMKTRFLPLIFILLIVMAGLWVWMSAKNNASKKPVSTNGLPVIILGAAPPSSNDLAARVIRKYGWDKEAGFQLETRAVAPEVAIPTIIGGTVDIIGMTPLAALTTVNPEKPITILANGNIVYCPFFVPEGSTLTTWQELKGKRLGATAIVGPSYNMTKIAMKLKENLDMDKAFIVSNSPFPELIPRLSRGEIDGAIGRCGEVGIAKAVVEAKFKVIGNLTDILYKDGDLSELMMEALVTTRDWATTHSELAIAFRETLYRAYAYIKDHPEVYDDPDIQKAYALDKSTPDVIAKVKELVPIFYAFKTWSEAIDSQYKFLKMAQEAGFFTEVPVKEELFFNPSVSPQP